MRRSRIDIVIKVLEVAKHGANKTAIVYRSNLNFKLADKYIEFLENQGFLEIRSDKFVTTDKGKIFIEKAKELILQLDDPEEKPKKQQLNPQIQRDTEIIPQQNAEKLIPWLEFPLPKSKERSIYSGVLTPV